MSGPSGAVQGVGQGKCTRGKKGRGKQTILRV